jgi:hypothetical protein
MNCAFSREVLALYVEGDLSDSSAADVRTHLARCAECERFCDGLERSQAMLKSLRRTTATPEALTEVRREVISNLDHVEQNLSWAIRVERFMLGFRRWRYATAGVIALALFAVVTTTVNSTRLERPTGYRQWVALGTSSEKSIYINPTAYQAFSETGRFPEGTVMVLETPSELQVSVKDTRYAGGWGYFAYIESQRDPISVNAQTCRTCHEERAETDHVFTQFYPALKMRKG